jgi:hypothetical protein
MITALVLVPFTGVSFTGPEPVADTPVSVPITVDVHANAVPVIDEVGTKFNAVLLQISLMSVEAVLVTTGVGLTVTVTSTGVPPHKPAEGPGVGRPRHAVGISNYNVRR